MVFSSVPLYLDPPNWQQHPNQQQQHQLQVHNNNHHDPNQHHLISPQLQQPQSHQLGSIGPGPGPGAQQIRANSMAERARLAKIPPPEVPQKCPRCDSTNTKFCYYNNYSLSQPRHFCKTCRRYWTRGGALRNVPVGGGCRRNKRSSNKSSSGGATSSKSTLSSTSQSTMVSDSSRGINVNSLSGMINSGVGNSNPMSFMASLQNIAQLGGISNMGLNFGGGPINTHNSNTTPLVTGGGGVGGGYNLEFPQQQLQFPNFLGGFEIPGSSVGGGIYSSFQNVHHPNNNEGEDHQQQQQELSNANDMSKSSSITSMMSPVKMEDNGQQHQGINLAKQLMMGISSSNDNINSNNNNNQFWGGNMTNAGGVTSMWTDLSGLNSSSSSHLL